MSIGMIVIGLVLVGLGALCAIVLRNKLSSKAVDVQYMRTTPIHELKQTFDDMKAGGLGDNLRQYVELQGVSASAAPPQAPYSQQEVAYYVAELVQVYETEEYYKDDGGQQQKRIVRKEETVTTEKSVQPLLIKDPAAGDTVSIDVQEGGLELLPGLDRFEPVDNMPNYGFFSGYVPRTLGNRTLGYRMRERMIPLGHSLYVLGEAYLRNGDVCIGKPTDGKKSFIVSTKSEAQIAREAKTGSTFALVGGIVLAVGGIVVAVMGFFPN